jgi:hypothetical protein
LHLSHRKKESVVCHKCHHGAKKVRKEVHIEENTSEGFGIEYDKEFTGVGLNRMHQNESK